MSLPLLLISGVFAFGADSLGTVFLHLIAPRPLPNVSFTVQTAGPLLIQPPLPQTIWQPEKALPFQIRWKGTGKATATVRIFSNNREIAQKTWTFNRVLPLSVRYQAPFLLVSGGEGSAEIAVFNISGRRILKRHVELGRTIKIRLHLVPGVYFWKLIRGEEREEGRWVVIR